MNEEQITIYDLGFDRNLQRNVFVQSIPSLEILENKIDKIFQSGDTVVSLIPGLLESEYNGI